MRERIMPIDQCRISIEARPLHELYSKYSPPDSGAALQSIRPLGRVRKARRSAVNGQSHTPHLPCVIPTDRTGGQRHAERIHHRVPAAEAYQIDGVLVERRSSVEEIMSRNQETDKSKAERAADSLSGVGESMESIKGKDYQFPSLSRSRAQAFEHQYKIAASRGALKEHQLPTKTAKKESNKKTIHLPLFRINVRTYNEETEESKTVENTRESLRQIMELHKSKLKPASIQNYEFSAPASVGSQTQRSCDLKSQTGGMISAPFPAQSILKANKHKTDQRNTLFTRQYDSIKTTRFMESFSRSMSDDNDNGAAEVKQSLSDEYEMGPEDEADDSLMSIAIRPDTALTLGSTIHHIDRVVKSPGSEELRELSEVFKSSDSQPAWPSFDDIQKMRAHAMSRKSQSRSKNSASLSNGNVSSSEHIPPQSHSSLYNDTFYNSREKTHHHHLHYDLGSYGREPTPKLKYTTKQPGYKLDPIIVPSHTCTECPMCNIYQRELEESPCPPNSPIGSTRPELLTHHSQEPIIINSSLGENTGRKPQSGSRFRKHPKQEVLHVSRIMVSGEVEPPGLDDHSVLAYMKANA